MYPPTELGMGDLNFTLSFSTFLLFNCSSTFLPLQLLLHSSSIASFSFFLLDLSHFLLFMYPPTELGMGGLNFTLSSSTFLLFNWSSTFLPLQLLSHSSSIASFSFFLLDLSHFLLFMEISDVAVM